MSTLKLYRSGHSFVYLISTIVILWLCYFSFTQRHTYSSWSLIQIGDTALMAPLSKYDSNGTIFRRHHFQNYDAEIYQCLPSSDGPEPDIHHSPIPHSQCVCDRGNERKVFILGLPKAGTGSLHRMFQSIGCRSFHWLCRQCAHSILHNIQSDGHSISGMMDSEPLKSSESSDIETFGYLGVAMDYAHRHNQSLLHYVPSRFTVFAQMDILENEHGLNVWPQMMWYRLLYDQYPDALFILNYRDLDRHIRSINNWNDLRARLIWNDIPGLPRGRGWRDSELKEWMLTHYCNVERFFMEKAPRSFLKYDIERDSVVKLEDFLKCSGVTIPHTHDTQQRCKNAWRC